MLLLLGLVGGGLYNWATSLYSYNRDAWMTDIQTLQAHDYQYVNLQIATHAMSRDQVRDRTTAVITKLNNYILVTTLIIALAAEMLVEGSLDQGCPTFISNVYMLCLGTAVLYLTLGAMFGLATSNVIYETSADLLTSMVPPPWESIDDKMRDREQNKMTQAFEHRPLKQIFMPPLLRRSYEWLTALKYRRWWRSPGSFEGDETSSTGSYNRLPLVEEEVQRGYRRRASDCSSRLSAGMAGRLSGGISECGTERPSRRNSASDFHGPHGTRLTDLGVWGIAVDAREQDANQEVHTGEDRRPNVGQLDKPVVHIENQLLEIQAKYESAWHEIQRWWEPMHDYSRRCVALGLQSLLEAYGYASIGTLYGSYGGAWAYWAMIIVFISLNVLLTVSMFEHGSSCPAVFMVTMGPLACAIAAWTPFLVADRWLVPFCYLCHATLACILGLNCTCMTRGTKVPLLCGASENAENTIREERAKELGDCAVLADVHDNFTLEFSNMSEEWTHNQVPGTADDSKLLRFASVVRAPLRDHWRKVTDLARNMFRLGGVVVTAFWVSSVCWALQQAWCSGAEYFRNDMALWQSSPGWQIADTVNINVTWPSVYFRPHAMVCPRDSTTFLATEFEVFELVENGDNRTVVPYKCDVEGIIADIASNCDSANASRCWPVLLMKGKPPRVYDCGKKTMSDLLQLHEGAHRFTTKGNTTLYVAHDRRVVEYRWSDRHPGWQPLWDVVTNKLGTIDAMDVAEDTLLLFRSEDSRSPGPGGSVELMNLTTGRACGVYELPASLVGAGCAQRDLSVVKLLTDDDAAGPGRKSAVSMSGHATKMQNATVPGGFDCRDEEGAAAFESRYGDNPVQAPAVGRGGGDVDSKANGGHAAYAASARFPHWRRR